jgi:hypothetical protein
MLGRLGEFQASLCNTGHPAEQPPTSGPKKGEASREPAIGVDQTARSSTHWEASDLRRAPTLILKRHSREWRFVRKRTFLGAHSQSSRRRTRSLLVLLPKAVPPETLACQRGIFPVLSELPIKRLTQATQYGLEQARRGASTSSSGSLIPIKLCVAKAHIGKGILREKQGLRRENSGGRMELIDDSRG